MSTTQPQQSIEEMAPSQKYVYTILSYEGEMTQRQIADATMLPVRTVRHALNELVDHGIVSKQPNFMDARSNIYRLEETDDD